MTTPASALASTAAASLAEPPARFRDLLASEWIKMRSLRSTPWTLALTILFVTGSAAVATLADKAAGSEPAGFLAYDAYPATGYMTLILVAGSMGALTVVSEYGSGMIRTTTVAVPDRGAVVLAKAVVTAVLWTAVGTAASIGSFLVSQAILNGRAAGCSDHPPRCLPAAGGIRVAGSGVRPRRSGPRRSAPAYRRDRAHQRIRLADAAHHVLGEQPLVGRCQTHDGVGRLDPPGRDLGARPRIPGLHRHAPRLLGRVRPLAAGSGRPRGGRRPASRRVTRASETHASCPWGSGQGPRCVMWPRHGSAWVACPRDAGACLGMSEAAGSLAW